MEPLDRPLGIEDDVSGGHKRTPIDFVCSS